MSKDEWVVFCLIPILGLIGLLNVYNIVRHERWMDISWQWVRKSPSIERYRIGVAANIVCLLIGVFLGLLLLRKLFL